MSMKGNGSIWDRWCWRRYVYGVGEGFMQGWKLIMGEHHERTAEWRPLSLCEAEHRGLCLCLSEGSWCLSFVLEQIIQGWEGWKASPTQWIWVWVNSRSWWWSGSPGVLRSMGLKRVRHDWVTKLNWTEIIKEGHENCVQDVEGCQMKEELDLLRALPGAPSIPGSTR